MNTRFHKHPNVIRWALIGGALALAWANRFVQDDAFISFRYARHFAEGHGLVYNIGERVEGYTNFLWTVCMAPAFILGMDVVPWSYLLSLLAFAVTLSVTASLAHAFWNDARAGLIAIVLLATNYSFSSYATGGLETQFGIAWLMLSIWLLHANRLVLAALCSACAVMTRMDAVLIVFPFWYAAASFGEIRQGSFKRPLRTLLAASVGALPVVLWLICRHGYYGAWLPNTFLIKGQGPTPLRGLCYMGLFYAVYGFWLLLPLLSKTALQRLDLKRHLPVLSAIVLWHLYLISVGGDFMEFRMMMPTLPLVVLLIAGLATVTATGGQTARQKIACVTLPAVVCVSLFLNVMKFSYPGIENFTRLGFCSEWEKMAADLNGILGEPRKSVTIGITAAGAIPFRTQMPTLDLLGLNSREVALTGRRVQAHPRFGNLPGHVRIATYETVMASGVHLLVNHPWVVTQDSEVLAWEAKEILSYWFLGKWVAPEKVTVRKIHFPADAPTPPIIAWPLSDGRYWLMAYLHPHPAVDAAIRRTGATVIRPANE